MKASSSQNFDYSKEENDAKVIKKDVRRKEEK